MSFGIIALCWKRRWHRRRRQPTKPTAVPTAIPTLKPTIAPTVTPSVTPDNSDKISGKKTLSKVILQVPKNKKGRKLVVRWNAVKDVKGYQLLQYASKQKFKRKKSVHTKTKNNIKKLKKKKTRTSFFVVKIISMVYN